jgi:hypothetical protein
MLLAILSALALVALGIGKGLLSHANQRYLIDSYGLDRKKLKCLSAKEMNSLRKSIHLLSKKNDPFALEALLRKFK